MLSAHEDLAGVFINSLFGVSGIGDVFDDHCVIWLILRVSGVIEKRVIK
jgi:hypothetical protein